MLKDHLNKLEYFCAIVEYKSLLKASKNVYISQPRLSNVLRELEEELGCQLLIRSKQGVQLTSSGEKLYRYARKTIDGANETQLLVNNSEDVKGVVRIGTYDSISRYFFPDFLKYLKKVMPRLTIELSTGRSEVMVKKLQGKELDAAIIVQINTNYSNIKLMKIYTDSFGLYGSTQLAPDFENCMILFPESIEELKSNNHNFGFKHLHICDNLETVKSLTEQGLGIGLLPHRVAREGVLSGKINSSKKTIKKSSTYNHDIVLAFKEDNFDHSTSIVIDEIKRFLKTWSKA